MASVEDRRKLMLRLGVLQYSVSAVFAILVLAFWWLQVVQYQHFREQAEINYQRTLALRAPRGVLYDRKDRVLVENRDSFNISIVREQTRNVRKTRNPRDTINLLARVTGVSEAALDEAVRRQQAQPRYRPIVVIEDASLAQVAAVAAHRLDSELPDVIVEQVPTRRYPTDTLAAHLFGYVGEVTGEQLNALGFRSGDVVGQAGIEKTYNGLLMGANGTRRVVINSVGREIDTIEEIPSSAGRRVRLTIDLDLQQAAEDAFKKMGYSGAAVFLDPRNGEILAYVSLPGYDPNRFAVGIDKTSWTALNTSPLHPLQNRPIQGRYSPGSTFKIVVATAALEEAVATPDFKVFCPGGGTFYGRFFECWKKGGHGWVDMRHALEQSCNTYFYTLGNMVGVDKIQKWASILGLGVKSGIDLPNEVEGLVPSTAWKRAKTGEKWYAGETISVSIGQGQVSVTPVSMAVMMATVANGGTRCTPHLVMATDDGHGWKTVPTPQPQGQVALKPETLDLLRQGLWMVVNGAGTGGLARIDGRDVVGKTGTAQVISLQGAKAAAGKTDVDLRNHGWFVFFAPRDNPQIAGVVLAEHALHGWLAAPIAKHVMETFFALKEGRTPPTFTPPPAAVAPAAGPG